MRVGPHDLRKNRYLEHNCVHNDYIIVRLAIYVHLTFGRCLPFFLMPILLFFSHTFRRKTCPWTYKALCIKIHAKKTIIGDKKKLKRRAVLAKMDEMARLTAYWCVSYIMRTSDI